MEKERAEKAYYIIREIDRLEDLIMYTGDPMCVESFSIVLDDSPKRKIDAEVVDLINKYAHQKLIKAELALREL